MPADPGGDRARSLAERIEDALRAAETREEGIRRVVEAIRDSNPLYHWTGVYLVDGSELELAYEIGKPTPHRRIPLGNGICGAAATEGRTIVVDDVHADPRYLACSLETRSEIVIPLSVAGRVVGEIDIDSDAPAAFTPADRSALEAAADLLSAFLGRLDPQGRPAGAGSAAGAARSAGAGDRT